MPKKWIVRLKIWNNYPSPKETRIQKSVLEKTIRSMASEQCANLLIDDPENDDGDGIIEGFPLVIISSSKGKYSVSVLIDEATCYDLIGDSSANGWIDFILGGQEAPFPRKYIVSVEQALAAASGYLDAGEAVLTKFGWDKQHEPDSAWNQPE